MDELWFVDVDFEVARKRLVTRRDGNIPINRILNSMVKAWRVETARPGRKRFPQLFFEGNYLSLDREPWRTAAGLMDELWFVDVDFEASTGSLIAWSKLGA
jgi:pantothenate kinase